MENDISKQWKFALRIVNSGVKLTMICGYEVQPDKARQLK
jgi:hypothetical protein